MDTHKHLLISGYVNYPFQDESKLHKWMEDLVSKIDMNILSGPHVTYLDKAGNRGISGIVMIDTSHIAIHIWDECSPALLQMDVYSCKDFNEAVVTSHLGELGVDSLKIKVLDRSLKKEFI